MAIDSLKGVRILIVDDEKMIRETLATLLGMDGAVVSEASNGNQAYDMIQEFSYHVVLSDIRMPECSGVDFLNRVKREKIKIPPVLLMSAFTDISSERAKELGARGMFIKDENSKYLKEMLLDIIE